MTFGKALIYKLSISCIIIGVLSAGLLYFSSNINTFTKKIADTRTALANKTMFVESFASLQKEYTEHGERELSLMNQKIPLYDQLVQVQREVEKLTTGETVATFSFSGENPKTPTTLGSISYKLSVLAPTFDATVSYIKNFEKMKFFNTIESVSFATRPIDNKIEATVQGRLFFR